jgi:ribonuclease HI
MNQKSQGSLFDDDSAERAASTPTSAIANIDGGSRGNPGPAAFGVYITLPDERVIELNGFIPHSTNNVAEYNGLLAALRWAVAHGVRTLHIRADSELLVKQMKGVYRVKNPGLIPLYEEARRLTRQIGRVSLEHVRREFNKEADRLCNEAMDQAARDSRPPAD